MTQQLYRERKDIMLCYPFSEKRFNTYPKPCYAQPKLEGDRGRAVWDKNIGYVLYSSSSKPIIMLPHINRALNDLNITDELDGEFYNLGFRHELIHGVVSRTVNMHRDYNKVQFHIFDVINPLPFEERIKYVQEKIKPSEHVRLVETVKVNDIKELFELYENWIDAGYEGIIIRSAAGLYLRCPTRSMDIMKLKPRQEDFYVCVEIFEETSIDGIPKGILGKILVQDADGNRFKVGTGFKLEQKQKYWNHPEQILGKIIRVRYQALTQNGIPKMASIKEVME